MLKCFMYILFILLNNIGVTIVFVSGGLTSALHQELGLGKIDSFKTTLK